MQRIKETVVKAIIGGFVVLIPLPILYFAFRWLFNVVIEIIEPLTTFLLRYIDAPKYFGDGLAFLAIIVACFFVGNFVQTRIGKFVHGGLEQNFLMKIPFYGMLKEIFMHVFGKGKFLACPTAVAEVLPGIHAAVLITDARDGDTSCVVFLPTGPNPTTGFMLHMPKERVEVAPNITKEEMFRAVISCGLDSKALFDNVKQ